MSDRSSPHPAVEIILLPPLNAPVPLAPSLSPKSIPEDILREVALYLPDEDRVKFSMLSKLLHTAFPSRPTDVVCNSSEKARLLRRYMLSNTSSWTTHLVALEFNIPGSTETELEDMSSMLRAARNLRRLTIGSREAECAKVRRAVRGLSHLSYLCLFEPGAETMKRMIYPESIRHFQVIHLMGTITWMEFAKPLSRLPHLATLTIVNSVLEDPESESTDLSDSDSEDPGPDAATRIPSLRGIRTLEALSVDLPSSSSVFGRIFPRLENLVLEGSIFDYGENITWDKPGAFKLQHLSVLACQPMETDLAGPPWRVAYVTVLIFDESHLDLSTFLTPHLVGLNLRVFTLTWATWTDHIMEHMPDIRMLEIESFGTDFPTALNLFVGLCTESTDDTCIPEEMPLAVLSIAAPRTRGRSRGELSEDKLCTRLLQNAPLTFPNLRYIALASPKKVPADFTDLSGDCAPWQWWRIVRTGSSIQVKEIPAWEGERVRKFMHQADRARADHFDRLRTQRKAR